MALAKHRNGHLIHTANGRVATSCFSCDACVAGGGSTPGHMSVAFTGLTLCPGMGSVSGSLNTTWVCPPAPELATPLHCYWCLDTGLTWTVGASTLRIWCRVDLFYSSGFHTGHAGYYASFMGGGSDCLQSGFWFGAMVEESVTVAAPGLCTSAWPLLTNSFPSCGIVTIAGGSWQVTPL